MAPQITKGRDTSVSSSRADGFTAACPVCSGPMVSAGQSESGRIFWAECLLCGRASGLQSLEGSR